MRLDTIRRVAMAVVLSLVMLSLQPMIRGSTVYADDPEPEPTATPTVEHKAELYEYYCGNAGKAKADGKLSPEATPGVLNPQATPTVDNTAFEDIDEGDIIWIGVGAEKMKWFTPGKENGVSSMEIAFNYDPGYLLPCNRNGETEKNITVDKEEDPAAYKAAVENLRESWLDYIHDYNFKAGADVDDKTCWNSDYYGFIENSSTFNGEPDYDEKYTGYEPTEAMQTAYVSIKQKTADDHLRFKSNNFSDEEKVIFMMLPFKVMIKPPAAEEKYLQLSLGPSSFSMGFSKDPTASYAAWEDETLERPKDNNETYNLQTYFKFMEDIAVLGYEPVDDAILDISLAYVKPMPSPTADPTATAPAATAQPTTTTVPFDINQSIRKASTDVYAMPSGDTGYGNGSKDRYYAVVPNEAQSIVFTVKKQSGASTNFGIKFSNLESDNAVTVPFTSSGPDGAVIFTEDTTAENAPELKLSEVKITDVSDIESEIAADATKAEQYADMLAGAYGFNNCLTVSLGSVEKKIYIRRYAEAHIDFNYGNSPVGMIMSNYNGEYDTEEKIRAEVERFKDKRTFDGVTVGMKYNVNAWKSYKGWEEDGTDYDGDIDPYALFIYQAESFRDPGFTAYDSMNRPIKNMNVSVLLTLSKLDIYGVLTYSDDEVSDIVLKKDTGENLLYTDIDDVFNVGDKKVIRPDVYKMYYTFPDQITGKSKTFTRHVIVVARRGDMGMDQSNSVGSYDAVRIRLNVSTYTNDNNINTLYKYKICDANNDGSLTSNDATQIISSTIAGPFYKSSVNLWNE